METVDKCFYICIHTRAVHVSCAEHAIYIYTYGTTGFDMDLLNDTRDTYARHVWEGIYVEVSCARSKEESNRLNITWTQVSRANVKVREEW